MGFMDIVDTMNGFVWGTPLIVLLLGTGAIITIGSGFFQFAHFGWIMKNTFGSITKKSGDGPGTISAFEAASIAYVVRVYAGKGADGKVRYLSRTYTPAPLTSPRKISQALETLCAELQQKAKDPGEGGAVRFSDYAQHFLQRKSLTVGEYTLQSYRLTLRKACEDPAFLEKEEASEKAARAMSEILSEILSP